MASSNTSALNSFSQDELSSLLSSLKSEKFRSHLLDFANELNNHENKKLFEGELREYERQRGVDIVFIYPTPGFSLNIGNQGSLVSPVFINICSNTEVNKPSYVHDVIKKGLNWSIPYVIINERLETFGAKKFIEIYCNDGCVKALEGFNKAMVHDVVFHPDALHIAYKSQAMKDTVINTAKVAISKRVDLGESEVCEVKGENYIGRPTQSVVRVVFNGKLFAENKENVIGCSPMEVKKERTIDDNEWKTVKKGKKKCSKLVKSDSLQSNEGSINEIISPVYKIKYINKVDLQDYVVSFIPKSGPQWQPQALVVDIELPGVDRASQVDAHVDGQCLVLVTDSVPQYRLQLPLPREVDEDSGSAKFDISTQILTMTLPVIESKTMIHSPASDSGIECDTGYRTYDDGDSEKCTYKPENEIEGSYDDDIPKESDFAITTTSQEKANCVKNSQNEGPYLLPSYKIKQTNDSLSVVVNCYNVLASSVSVIYNVEDINIRYSSIGNGRTVLHYGLVVALPMGNVLSSIPPRHHLSEETLEVLISKTEGLLTSLRIGRKDAMTTVVLASAPSADVQHEIGNKFFNVDAEGAGLAKSVECDQDVAELHDKEEEVQCQMEGKQCPKSAPWPLARSLGRTMSECERRGPTGSWPRGILKCRTRSLSESNVDSSPLGLAAMGSSLELDPLEDEEEEGLASSLCDSSKKCVRFSEVVSRQVFRANNSILGQRAKNQKKAQRKRKCLERRVSESDKESDSLEKRQNHSSFKDADSKDDVTNEEATTDTDTMQDEEDQEDKPTKATPAGGSSVQADKAATVGASKKRKSKSKKSKSVELSNNMIFQLDIES